MSLSSQKILSLYKSELGYQKIMGLYDELLAQCPFPVKSEFVNTKYGRTHVLISGESQASPIILLHGWGTNSAAFYSEYPSLMKNHSVYAIDIIGHAGKSELNKLSPFRDEYASWLLNTIDELSLQTVNIVGASGGGWLTLKFSLAHPNRVRKSIVISPMGITGFKPSFSATLLKAFLNPTIENAKAYAELITSEYRPTGRTFETFYNNLFLFIKYYRGVLPSPFLLPAHELKKIHTPLLLLAGEYENVFDPIKMISRTRQYIESAECVLVKNAGHAMTIDQPKVVGDYILSFLESDA